MSETAAVPAVRGEDTLLVIPDVIVLVQGFGGASRPHLKACAAPSSAGDREVESVREDEGRRPQAWKEVLVGRACLAVKTPRRVRACACLSVTCCCAFSLSSKVLRLRD